MGRVVLLLICLLVPAIYGWGSSDEKVLLSKVEAITLKDGHMTTGRRVSPIQQLIYKGSSNLRDYRPQRVQCYNRGSDGYDVQWECAADMPNEVKFGDINVICEGYGYPDDPYILKGSCALEYSLEATGQQSYGNNKQHYSSAFDNTKIKLLILLKLLGNKSRQSSHSSGGGIGTLIVVCVIIYLVYNYCIKTRPRQTTPEPERRENENRQQGSNRLYPDLDPPPYPGTEPSAPEEDGSPPPYGWAPHTGAGAAHPGSYKTSGSQPRNTPPPPPGYTPAQDNNQSQFGGFWSGAGIGGALGYLFGRGGNTRGYRQQPRSWWGGGNSYWNQGTYPRQSGWNSGHGGGSSWFGSGNTGSSWSSSTSSGTTGSSGSRRSTGFGGTSRR